jgi:holo-[acyl-carrier protein] synthase
MIYHGIDMIEVARVSSAAERFGERFLRRVFTAAELDRYRGRPESLAARFAAKEAAAKLLGVGLRGLGAGPRPDAVAWTEIEVLADQRGRPTIALAGAAAERAAQLGLSEFAVSLSHTGALALASVVAIGGAGRDETITGAGTSSH